MHQVTVVTKHFIFTDECKGLVHSGIKFSYAMAYAFSTWEMTIDTSAYLIEAFFSRVYIDWTECIKQEIIKLNSG